MNKKIVLICNDSNTVINFRKELIEFLLSNNNEVFVIVGDHKREQEIINLGVSLFIVPFSNRSINPFSLVSLKRELKKILLSIYPDIVLTFQIKPNIIGALASKKICSNVFCFVEGLGDPFQPRSLLGLLVRNVVCFLYRKATKFAKKVFVLNLDDANELANRHAVKREKIVIIPGIGIDVDRFCPEKQSSQKRIIYLSRLIKNKGIFDYCKIAQKVRSTRQDICFFLYGEESELSLADIKPYIDDNSIIYGGFSNNPAKIIKESNIVVSTSLREGFPRMILEAMALQKPTIATNVIGNKSIVEDGVTGYLLPVHDIDSFSKTIIMLIDDDELMKKLGKNARKICEEKYDCKKINEIIYSFLLDT